MILVMKQAEPFANLDNILPFVITLVLNVIIPSLNNLIIRHRCNWKTL